MRLVHFVSGEVVLGSAVQRRREIEYHLEETRVSQGEIAGVLRPA
jgi:hypothetical protein